MTASERRVIISMLLSGLIVIVIGLTVVALGWSEWWFRKTHLLGSFGVEMLVYGLVHAFLYRRDQTRRL